jgi:hypothetical protein
VFSEWQEEVLPKLELWQVVQCAKFDTVPCILRDAKFIRALSKVEVMIMSRVVDSKGE